MAYNVSNDWIEKCYSGESLYDCRLIVENKQVPIEQIEKIDINSPIIDNSSQDKPFYIGTFISQSITIKFRNLDGINIHSGARVDLYIGQEVDDEGTYEEIPIGKYLIDELAENYEQTCEITCLDYAIRFSSNCDYSSALTNGSITIDNLLIWICSHYGVELGTYPTTNGDVEVGSYDNTLSGKYYISCIAEIKGCNAKIDRIGRLILIPIKSSPTRTIDALESKSFELGEKYSLKTVTYFDAIRNFTFGSRGVYVNYNDNPLYYEGHRIKFTADAGNTLIIRQDNPFIVDETVVENIYNEVKDLEIWSLKCENYGDLSLDAWDLVTYTLDDKTYTTFYNNTTTYEMTVMATNNVQIPNKQQEVTTNVVGGTQEQKIRRVSTTVDNLSGQITLNASEIDELQSNVGNLTITSQSLEATVKNIDEVKLTEMSSKITEEANKLQIDINRIDKTLTQDGVPLVTTKSVVINDEGLSVVTNTSKIKTTMTNNEFKVTTNEENPTTLTFIGYDEEEHTSKSEMDNLTVHKYFISGNHRREGVRLRSSKTGQLEDRTAEFYIKTNS